MLFHDHLPLGKISYHNGYGQSGDHSPGCRSRTVRESFDSYGSSSSTHSVMPVLPESLFSTGRCFSSVCFPSSRCATRGKIHARTSMWCEMELALQTASSAFYPPDEGRFLLK